MTSESSLAIRFRTGLSLVLQLVAMTQSSQGPDQPNQAHPQEAEHQ